MARAIACWLLLMCRRLRLAEVIKARWSLPFSRRNCGSTPARRHASSRLCLSSRRGLGRLAPPLRYRLRVIGHRRPPGDDPRALAGLRVVADQREVALELDFTGQLAAVLVGAADGVGGGLVDHEHAVLA